MRDFLRERKRVFCILAPAAFGALYMILCMANLKQSIWLDESYSAYLTRFDFAKIWGLTAVDVHPPFYYFLLKIWSNIFGFNVFSMRAMSVVFGAMAILFAFLWLKYKYGNAAAIMGAFFMSISPVLIRYGQEMRMYTLVIAIVFAATYVMQLAIDTGKRKWWIIYACLLALGMWTHYFVFFAWVAQLIYLATIYKKAFFQKKIILTYVLAIVLFLPWLPGLISQTVAVQNGFWIGDVSATSLSSYWSETLLYARSDETTNWLLALSIATTILFVTTTIKYHKKMSLLTLLAIVPPMLLILLSMPPLSPMFIPRYVMYAMVSIALIGALDVVLLWRDANQKKAKTKVAVKAKRRQFATCLGLALLLVTSSICGIVSVYAKGNFNFDNNSKSTTGDLYSSIVALDGDENLPIIATSSELEPYFDLSFYSTKSHPVYFIDEVTDYKYGSFEPMRASNFADFGKINDLDDFLSKHDSFWYVGEKTGDNDIKFPRDGYTIVETSNLNFAEHSSTYQVIKYQKTE